MWEDSGKCFKDCFFIDSPFSGCLGVWVWGGIFIMGCESLPCELTVWFFFFKQFLEINGGG